MEKGCRRTASVRVRLTRFVTTKGRQGSRVDPGSATEEGLMANEEHVALLKQGVDAWNAWRRENPNVSPDLSRANLAEADLSKEKLLRADLSEVNLLGVNLRGADLFRADLFRASLLRS